MRPVPSLDPHRPVLAQPPSFCRTTPPSGGWPAFRRLEQATIATWLKAAGYRTSLVGKYLNDYPKNAAAEYIPPGWDDWYGHLSAIEDGRYFNYWVNDNGRRLAARIET